MSDEKNDFKVVDKRGTTRPEETPRGEGFTMKTPAEPEPASAETIDFSTLIFSLATGALINLGVAPDPVTKKRTKNLPIARQNIDILSMLQAKTKGNLSTEENQLLESLLSEVRVRFVEASKPA